MLRTHHLGQLSDDNLDQNLTLCGWVDRVREVGGVNFVVLRDRYANLQLNVDGSLLSGNKLSREDCILVEGILAKRPEKDCKEETNGSYELTTQRVEILNKSETPPFVVDDKEVVNEDLRLKYRYLDLRKESMKRNLLVRHQVVESIRSILNGLDFLEVETPLLMKSTPEGARDFLVPSRVFPGEFYALPQSPQLYKQMIQVCGLDRYYQFPRCFRDEDARGDRQMVHTQLDLEMSFVHEDDVFSVIEKVLGKVFADVKGVNLPESFERMNYSECIERFGLDKPDLRFGMELYDLDEVLKGSPYEYFNEVIESGGRIAAMTVPGGAKFSRKILDGFSNFVKAYRSKGVFFFKYTEDGFSGGASKHLPEGSDEALLKLSGAKEGDLIVFVADKAKVTNDSMGYLRNHVAKKLHEESGDFIPEGDYKLLWVTNFPLFEYNPDEDRWDAMHHMFTMPKEEDLKYFETGEYEKIHGRLYDLVLNGVELGSGSIRIHRPELQRKIFDVVGFTPEQAESRFGFFLECLKYGAPPHGGIALGLARLVMTLLELDNMRDVIAFPNASSNRYFLDDSPTRVSEEQLSELHLQTRKTEE